MLRETIWLDHDNYTRLVLKIDGQAQDTSSITQIKLVLTPLSGDTSVVISSTNGAGDKIRWNQSGYETGEVRLNLGGATTLTEGTYWGRLIVYDTDLTEGIVWGEEPIEFVAKSSPLG